MIFSPSYRQGFKNSMRIMQAALNRVQRWCEDHGLSVNPDKTEMVLFTRKRTLPGLIPIVFFGKELERTNKVKYLGVVLDSKLTWSEHVDQKCKKATALFWQCRRIVGSTHGVQAQRYVIRYT